MCGPRNITYIPMAHGFLYLVAIIDWASRAVLAWRLSNHDRQRAFAIAAAGGASCLRHGSRRIFQHRSGKPVHQRRLHWRTGKKRTSLISMDGRGRFMDNIFIERLWRSIKYEEVHLKAYATVARRGRHQFLGDLLQFSAPTSGHEQPDADGGVARRHGQDRGGGEGCGYAASLGTTQTRCPHTYSRNRSSTSGLIF